jgi:NAD(P)-dependent dehydrogenase (short-subunit alcohol dehydrogenase family)
MTLEGKHVLILGGSSGIGFAVAEAALGAGAEVGIVSSRKARIDRALAKLGRRSVGYTADLSDEGAVQDLFNRTGAFDHLVFTAGDAVWQRPIGETALSDARDFFAVRFWGAFAAAKHGRRLIRPGGSMVFTSSTLPHRPNPGFAIGASISAGVEALTRALAVELAPIRVNAVAPGIIRTPIWERLPEADREAFFASRGASLPAGRVGCPADVAEAYLFLMRSEFTTGQSVVVDGGMLVA